MNHYFLQLYDCSGRYDTKVELDLSNFAMTDIAALELKPDLASFKTKKHNIDVEISRLLILI